MLDTIALLAMMSMVLFLLRRNQTGGDITEFIFRHLREEEVILCSSVEILKFVDEHCMRMLANTVLGVICLSRARGRYVLSLLSRPLRLDLKAIRLQMSLFLAIVSQARLGCAAAGCTPSACLYVAFVVSAPIFVVVIHDVVKSQPLVGSVHWGFLPLPRRQQVLGLLHCRRLGLLTLDIVVLQLCDHLPILAYVRPKEECSR